MKTNISKYKKIVLICAFIGVIIFILQIIFSIIQNKVQFNILTVIKYIVLGMSPYFCFYLPIKDMENDYYIKSRTFVSFFFIGALVLFFSSYIYAYIETFDETFISGSVSISMMVGSFSFMNGLISNLKKNNTDTY